MEVRGIEDERKIGIDLDETEAGHLLTYLLHAKFSDDVRLEIPGSPTMQGLLRGMFAAGDQLGFEYFDRASPRRIIDEAGGEQAPLSFLKIESGLKRLLGKEDISDELEECLYPWVWRKPENKQRFIPPGTFVTIKADEPLGMSDRKESAIVLQCWSVKETGTFECYVAMRDEMTSILDVPESLPEIRKYPTSQLAV